MILLLNTIFTRILNRESPHWDNDWTDGLDILFAEDQPEEDDKDDQVQAIYNTNREIHSSDANFIQPKPIWQETPELARYGPQWWLRVNNANEDNTEVDEGLYSDE